MGAEWGDMGCPDALHSGIVDSFLRHEEIDFTKVFSVSLPIWMLVGLYFGFNMKRYYRKNS